MADVSGFHGPISGHKRTRTEADDDLVKVEAEHQRKHARPTISGDDFDPGDTIISPSMSVVPHYTYVKYDSDGPSSLMSEPGSPQDLSMSSSDQDEDDDMMDEFYAYSPPEDNMTGAGGSGPWRDAFSRRNRISTPFTVKLPRPTSSRPRSGVQQHIRQRHPQENSCEHRDPPSPVDEDEVSTPQSAAAAEAAGSQLSMLSMSDMDMTSSETSHTVTVKSPPAISPSQSQIDPGSFDTEHAVDPMLDSTLVRKGRLRSGAQSSGSASPGRVTSLAQISDGRRGFSVGYRSDCEKCRMHIPGHMNHFIS